MYLIFDTETTGLPKRWDAPLTDSDNWPRCIQIAWQVHDEMGKLIEHQDYLVKPDGFNIPYDAEKVHGISTELASEQGVSLQEVLDKFNIALSKSKFVVGQNVGFDVNIMGAEFRCWIPVQNVQRFFVNFPAEGEVNSNSPPLPNFTKFFSLNLLLKLITLLPMLRQLPVASWN
jgi:DNA polymerase III epsilon subunit-like protein